MSAVEPTPHKVFVGGLSWTTTEDQLLNYFRAEGEAVEDVQIMYDRATQRSRGFGFMTVSSPDAVQRLLARSSAGEYILDGRRIEAKRAVAAQAMAQASRKLFVGGLPQEVSETHFRNYWARFGELVECLVMKDRITGRSRGFGFVSFRDDSCVDSALGVSHSFFGRSVEVKVAEPKKQAPGIPMASMVPTYGSPGGFTAYPSAYTAQYGLPFLDQTQLQQYLQALMVIQQQQQQQQPQQQMQPTYNAVKAFGESVEERPAHSKPSTSPSLDEPEPPKAYHNARLANRHSIPAPSKHTAEDASPSFGRAGLLADPYEGRVSSRLSVGPVHYHPPRVKLASTASAPSGLPIPMVSADESPSRHLRIKVTPSGEQTPQSQSTRTSRSSSRSSKLPLPLDMHRADVAQRQRHSAHTTTVGRESHEDMPQGDSTKPRGLSSPPRWHSDLVPWNQSSPTATETILKYFRSPASSPPSTTPPSSDAEDSHTTGSSGNTKK